MTLQNIMQPSVTVIKSPVTALTFQENIDVITTWALAHSSRFVCVANTHMLIEAYKRIDFGSVLCSADLVTPDGMPLVWMMKLFGFHYQDRVAGMDLFLALCKQAESLNIPVFFVGSQLSVLRKIKQRLEKEFPSLNVAGMEPLPFSGSVPEVNEALIEQINTSASGLVFVALGCPKQEYWMARHKFKVKAVMLGLGGVFPVYAGIQRHAPAFLRKVGLEWLYRLLQEPRRLWRRYATTIPIFLWLAGQQLFQELNRPTIGKIDTHY